MTAIGALLLSLLTLNLAFAVIIREDKQTKDVQTRVAYEQALQRGADAYINGILNKFAKKHTKQWHSAAQDFAVQLVRT